MDTNICSVLMGYSSPKVALDAWQRTVDAMNPSGRGYFNDDLEFLRGIIMAGKKSSRAAASRGNNDWKGFANVSLSDADKASIRSTQISDDELFDCLQTVISQGHKVTITKKAGKDATVVSFTGADDASPNKGYTLSSFAPTLRDAIIVNYYKHHYICQGTWKDLTDDNDEDFG